MIETYRKLKQERSAVDDSGFTLIELLIVIVVLGILAAIVVFALGGVTGKSVVAACNSDTKTVDVAAQAYLTENPTPSAVPANNAGWMSDLLPGSVAIGAPFLQSWPQIGVTPVVYTITVAGTAEAAVTLTGTGQSGKPNIGDVIVTIPGVVGTDPHAGTYDATTSPSSSCQWA